MERHHCYLLQVLCFLSLYGLANCDGYEYFKDILLDNGDSESIRVQIKNGIKRIVVVRNGVQLMIEKEIDMDDRRSLSLEVDSLKDEIGEGMIGDRCSEDEDCKIKDSECNHHVCSCRKHYRLRNGLCLEKHSKHDRRRGSLVPVGGSCIENEDCSFKHSECKDTKCVCEEDYMLVNCRCVEYDPALTTTTVSTTSEITETTTSSTSQITETASNDNLSTTTAVPTTSKVTKVTYEKQLLGSLCEEDDDCLTLHAKCEDKICVCGDGCITEEQPPQEDTTVDIGQLNDGSVSALLGIRCREDDDCLTDHAECESNECMCLEGYSVQRGTCVKNECLEERSLQAALISIGCLLIAVLFAVVCCFYCRRKRSQRQSRRRSATTSRSPTVEMHIGTRSESSSSPEITISVRGAATVPSFVPQPPSEVDDKPPTYEESVKFSASYSKRLPCIPEKVPYTSAEAPSNAGATAPSVDNEKQSCSAKKLPES